MLRGSRLVALVAAACCCTVSDALLLGPHPPCHRHVAAASTAGRARTLRCEEASPQEVEAVKNIPPEMLAAAWEREEEAKELSALLKGCQVRCRTACMHGGDMRASAMHMRYDHRAAHARAVTGVSRSSHVAASPRRRTPCTSPTNLPQVYLVGLSTRKIAVGRALARRSCGEHVWPHIHGRYGRPVRPSQLMGRGRPKLGAAWSTIWR